MSFIQTFPTARRFDFDDFRAESIRMEDIAHSLSMQCRFTGHCSRFYSVAEHSLLVARRVAGALAEDATQTPFLRAWVTLKALCHEAAEAYIGDVARPLKGRLRIATGHAVHDVDVFIQLDAYERELLAVIGEAVGIPSLDIHEPVIKTHDDRALITEKRDLLQPSDGKGWPDAEPYDTRIAPHTALPSKLWRDRFLEEYGRLKAAFDAARKEESDDEA